MTMDVATLAIADQAKKETGIFRTSIPPTLEWRAYKTPTGVTVYAVANKIRYVYGPPVGRPGWFLQAQCRGCKSWRQVHVTRERQVTPAQWELQDHCPECKARIAARVPCDLCRRRIDPPADGAPQICEKCAQAREERRAADERRAAMAAEDAAHRQAAREAFAAAAGVTPHEASLCRVCGRRISDFETEVYDLGNVHFDCL